jgi:hypothetical protein
MCNFIGNGPIPSSPEALCLFAPAEGKFQRTATSLSQPSAAAHSDGWGTQRKNELEKDEGLRVSVEDAVSISEPSTTQPGCSRLPKASKEYYEMRLNKSRQR